MFVSNIDVVREIYTLANLTARFVITETEDSYKFIVQEPARLEDLLSSISDSKDQIVISTRKEDAHKLPHNLAAAVLSKETDVPLSTILPLADQSDNLTPDIVTKTDEGWKVIEVKTFKVDPETQILRARKYEQPLQMRAIHCQITFDIVLVTDFMVLTSLPLSQAQVDLMVGMYNLGNQMVSAAFELGFRIPDEISEAHDEFWAELRNHKHCQRIKPAPFIKLDGSYESCQLNHVKLALDSRAEIKVSFADSGELRVSPVFRLPFFSSAASNPAETREHLQRIEAIDTMSSIWQQAADKCDMSHWQSRDSEQYYRASVREDWEPEQDDLKSQRFRFFATLSEQDRVVLAKKGLQKKKIHKQEVVNDAYESSKTPFSLESDTRAIDEQIESEELFERGLSPCNHNYLEWILSDIEPEMATLLQTVDKQFWFTSLQMLHSIMAEVNISRRQNCKKDQFIMKPVGTTGVLLLIKPTKANKQIFVSVAVRKADALVSRSSCFPQFLSYGTMLISEFAGFDQHKISHLLYCHAKMFSVYWCSVSQFGLRLQRTREQEKVFNLCLMVYLEDKEKTSNDLLCVRYLYMEALKEDAFKLKILNRLEPLRRSSLQVWVQKKIIEYAKSQERVSMLKSLDLLDAKNLFTGDKLRTMEQILFLSYIGVLHNKDESDEVQGFYKIFNKVLKEERLLLEVSPDLGHKCPGETFKSHEYCPRMVHEAAKLCRSELQEKGFHSIFKQEIPSYLMSKTWEDFATSKASFAYEGDLSFRPEDSKSYRVKCYEAAYVLASESKTSRPFSSIGHLIDLLIDRGGVRANLFKKLQLSGVREIYVLDMLSRVCINYVESISRIICSKLFGETLSNPKMKSAISSAHYLRANKVLESEFETGISSDDATTWAQKFMMSMFIHMFSEILPDEYKDSVYAVLNMVTEKKLQIPNRLLKKLVENKQTSPELQLLANDFCFGGYMMDANQTFVRNRSNMMMGILHYTSSLYHWCYLRFVQMTGYSLAKSLDEKVVITFKCSSDDSSMLVSSSTQCSKVIKAILHLKHELMPSFGLKSSHEKSTYCVMQNVEEFNSKWYVRNTLLSVPLKFCFSACKINRYLNLKDLVSQLASSRKQLLEEGCGIRMAALVQLSHAMMFYCSLACDVNEYNRVFLSETRGTHPYLGSFVYEPSQICGMFGEQGFTANKGTSYWSWESLFVAKNVSNTDATHRLKFELGESKKHRAMLHRLGNVQDARDQLNSEPIELFWKPSKHQSLLSKMLLSASNPLVAESFKFLSEAETHAASVYILRDAVWSDYKEKVRLSHYLKYKENLQPALQLRDIVNPEWSLIKELSEIDFGRLVPKIRARQRLLHITIEKRGVQALCSVKEACLYKWFGVKQKTKFELEESWSLYKKAYYWLDDSFEATKSLLEVDAVGLYHLVTSLSERQSKLNILSSAKTGVSELETLANIIRQTQWSDLTFQTGDFEQGEVKSAGTRNNLYSLLLLASSGPRPEHSVGKIITAEFKVRSDVELMSELPGLTQDETKMMLFCQLFTGGSLPKSALMRAKVGKICYHVDYGSKRVYFLEWPTFTVEMLTLEENNLRVITQIKTSNRSQFLMNKRDVLSAIMELNLQFKLVDSSRVKLNPRLEYTDKKGVEFLEGASTEKFQNIKLLAEVTSSGRMRLVSKVDDRFVTVFLFDPKMRMFKLPLIQKDYGLTMSQSLWLGYKSASVKVGLALLSQRTDWVASTLRPKILMKVAAGESRMIDRTAFEMIRSEELVYDRVEALNNLSFSADELKNLEDMFGPVDSDEQKTVREVWAEDDMFGGLPVDENLFEHKLGKRSPIDLQHPFWDDTVTALIPLIRTKHLPIGQNLYEDLMWLGVLKQDASQQDEEPIDLNNL